MSRSYKNFPCAGSTSKWEKRNANVTVRRNSGEIPNGKHYRKMYQGYDIWEGTYPETYESFRIHGEQQLRAYIHGGLSYDPREGSWNNFDYMNWYKEYKMK